MGRVSSVIFDVGNVLIRWDPKNLYRRIGYADADSVAILAETGLHEMNLECDRGRPFAEAMAELAERHPRHREFIEAFDTRWTDMLDGAIESNVSVLRDLKAVGTPVYAITNFARSKFDVACEIFPFLNTFDDIVVSADVGVLKPDPAIFRLLLERRQLDPSAAVFVDDSAKNVAAAAALGMHAIHATEGVSLREELRAVGFAI